MGRKMLDAMALFKKVLSVIVLIVIVPLAFLAVCEIINDGLLSISSLLSGFVYISAAIILLDDLFGKQPKQQ